MPTLAAPKAPSAPKAPAPKKPALPKKPGAPKKPGILGKLKLPGAGPKRDPNIPRRPDDIARAIAKVVATLLVFAMLGFLLSVWLTWRRKPANGDHGLGHTALWLAPTWTADFHDPTDFDSLAAELATYQVTDLFVAAGNLGAAGTLPRSGNQYAVHTLTEIHVTNPGVRIWASLQGVPSEGRTKGPVNLEKPAVRAAIASTSAQLITLGFSGVNLDLTPVASGDTGFLKTVSAVRAATAGHGLFSVEGAEVEPAGGAARAAGWIAIPRFVYRPWSLGYYRAVAAQADQIVVRAYGTGLPTTWTYGSYVGWETHELMVHALGPRTTLLMDLSTRARSGLGHQAWAENIGSGVRGVREGMRSLTPAGAARVGVSMRDQLTATPGEFATLGRTWVCTATGAPECVSGAPPIVYGVAPAPAG